MSGRRQKNDHSGRHAVVSALPFSNAALAEVYALPFTTHRAAALALLTVGARLTRKAGAFRGQCCVDPSPLSDRQLDWLDGLLARAGLPPLAPEAIR